MQVHTREAIKRKALIPICNCFSISTGLLTGPKSGNTLSPVSRNTAHRPFLIPVFHSTPRRESRARCSTARRESKTAREGFFTYAYRKQTIAPPAIEPPRSTRFTNATLFRRLSHKRLHEKSRFTRVDVPCRVPSCFLTKSRYDPSATRVTQRPPYSAHRPNFSVLGTGAHTVSSKTFFVRSLSRHLPGSSISTRSRF